MTATRSGTEHDRGPTGDAEIVDSEHRVVLRRIVVGPLATNCWVLHGIDDRRGLLIDPGAEPDRILDAVADLDVRAIVLSHRHFDHVLALPEVADALGVPVLAHPGDGPVWPHELEYLARHGHFDAGTATAELLRGDETSLRPVRGQLLWDGQAEPIHDRQQLNVGPLQITVLHTPGHTPGGVTLAFGGHLLTGDTLFPGGPGLTGWPLSDFPAIMGSVRLILGWPHDTEIHPGHGPDTTAGRERPQVGDWQRRGW